MFNIINKEELAPGIKKIEIEARDISRKVRAGQFVIIRVDDKGERIPLTVVDSDRKLGTITLIFQEVGKTTDKLGRRKVGDSILDLVGPLGRPTEIKNYGRVVAVGGGVGIAELYPVLKALKEAKNRICGIIGARDKELLILKDELRKICDELYITTDDGSLGEQGFAPDLLKREIAGCKKVPYRAQAGKRIDLVYAIGPVAMMRAVCEITTPADIKTVVSLNSIMVDGTGMCGSCRVKVGGENRFACVHGPEFEGDKVDFAELEARLKLFLDAERKAKECCQDEKTGCLGKN